MYPVLKDIGRGVVVTVAVSVIGKVAECAAEKVVHSLRGVYDDYDISDLYADEQVSEDTGDTPEGELSKVLSLFMTRYEAAIRKDKKALSYKDMLCNMCCELVEIAPRLEDPKKSETEKFVSFVEKGLSDGSDLEVIAGELFKQMGGGKRKAA